MKKRKLLFLFLFVILNLLRLPKSSSAYAQFYSGITALISVFGTTNSTYDFNDDSRVNCLDFGILLKILPYPSPTPSLTPGQGGVLQFKSGFEANTYIKTTRTRKILGTDLSTGYDWNLLANSVGTAYLPWSRFQAFYNQPANDTYNPASITVDPVNPNNKVLLLHLTQADGNLGRSQWQILTLDPVLTGGLWWVDDSSPNKFDQQFYRYRMLIPTETGNAYAVSERSMWYMIWESHAWNSGDFSGEQTRYGVYIVKYPNDNSWHFEAVKQRPEGASTCTICWNSCGTNPWTYCNPANKVAVPFGQWFTFEIFFKYHETDGEFYVAIQEDGKPRQIVGHFTGQTKHDQKFHDQMIFKIYHSSDYFGRLPDGTRQYYDDFEIWSDYPPGYW